MFGCFCGLLNMRSQLRISPCFSSITKLSWFTTRNIDNPGLLIVRYFRITPPSWCIVDRILYSAFLELLQAEYEAVSSTATGEANTPAKITGKQLRNTESDKA